MAALVVGALARAAGRRQLAGAAWALAILVKWVAVVFLPLRALEARATGRRVAHSGFALAAAVVLALATGATASAGSARSARSPQRRTRRRASRSRTGSSSSACRTSSRSALSRPRSRSRTSGCARGLRGRARLGLAAARCLLADAVPRAWYLAWAVPLAAAEDDDRRSSSRSRSPPTCCRRPSRSRSTRRKTSTPSSLEDEPPARVAAGAGASARGRPRRGAETRSRLPGRVSSTTTQSASRGAGS